MPFDNRFMSLVISFTWLNTNLVFLLRFRFLFQLLLHSFMTISLISKHNLLSFWHPKLTSSPHFLFLEMSTPLSVFSGFAALTWSLTDDLSSAPCHRWVTKSLLCSLKTFPHFIFLLPHLPSLSYEWSFQVDFPGSCPSWSLSTLPLPSVKSHLKP